MKAYENIDNFNNYHKKPRTANLFEHRPKFEQFYDTNQLRIYKYTNTKKYLFEQQPKKNII